jgi:hypothetical protein
MATEVKDHEATDLGHQVAYLASQLSLRVSRIALYPQNERILDVTGHPASAICLPLGKKFVMTSRGLARVTRFLVWKRAPQLLSHTAITLLEPMTLVWLKGAIDAELKRDELVFEEGMREE